MPGFDAILQRIQRERAVRKADRIAQWIPSDARTLLDVGAGEGYVAEALAMRFPALSPTLTDTLDYHRVDLPFVRANPDSTLPFADAHFDVAVLYFVLHHAQDARALLAETCRISRVVIVVESVYIGVAQHRLLRTLDQTANAIRSGGQMDPNLNHRTAAEWRQVFCALGLDIRDEFARGRYIHRQAYFVVAKNKKYDDSR